MAEFARLLASSVDVAPECVGLLSWRRQRDVIVSVHRPGPAPWRWRRRDVLSPGVLSIALLLEGTVTVTTSDGCVEDASTLLVHGTHETLAHFSDDAMCAILWMPMRIVESQGVPLPLAPLSLPTTALTAAMHRFVASIARQPAETPVGTYIIERLLVEMTLGVVLQAKETVLPPRSTHRLRERAHALILLHRADPEFGTDDIARTLGVSTRHLQRAFAESGTSPMSALRDARVQHAKTLTSDDAYDTHSVAEIARECGFGSAVTMRRAFQAVESGWPSRRRRADTASGPA